MGIWQQSSGEMKLFFLPDFTNHFSYKWYRLELRKWKAATPEQQVYCYMCECIFLMSAYLRFSCPSVLIFTNFHASGVAMTELLKQVHGV